MRTIYSLLPVISLVVFTSCQSKTKLELLKESVNNELSKVEGTFGIAFKNLENGEQLLINEKETFHAASTMKTPVLIEVYKQAAEGKFALEDSITVINEFRSIVDGSPFQLSPDDDSEVELYNEVGSKKTLYDLVYQMIIVSSNLATNIVIENVGAKNVMSTMKSLGANDIQVLRGVEDQKAYDAGMSNTTTAYDLMILFEKLAKGEAVNPEADKKMIDILFDQEFNEIIPAKLPAEVRVAHKTGSITAVRHDSGIVFLPDGRKYVLITLSKELKNPEEGIAAMANVSELIYNYVANK
ncbi:MAG TPA: class A beta-lactamase-related serine hydrolase [Cyclobacteriaceae bacterium]|nr:class A beta-lactamase-related serine hydrolase [Cyclobacteriaceae bacterium]